MHKVGVDTPDEFHFLAGLGKVGVVDNQAGCPVFPVGADFYTSPELGIDVVHELAPVDAHVTQEIVEHILLTVHQAA